jgi:hypothetical protein
LTPIAAADSRVDVGPDASDLSHMYELRRPA